MLALSRLEDACDQAREVGRAEGLKDGLVAGEQQGRAMAEGELAAVAAANGGAGGSGEAPAKKAAANRVSGIHQAQPSLVIATCTLFELDF